MAISFPITMPTIRRPSRMRFTPIKADGETIDPFSFATQTFEFPGERWQVEVALLIMPRSAAQVWIAALVSMRGKIGSINLYDPGWAKQGTASGSISASGSARARTVSLTGGSGTFKAGDFITINSRYLHQILADGTVGGSFDIWPALRAAASGTIVYTNPYGRFVLAEPPTWEDQAADIVSVSPFRCQEDMRA